MPSTLLTGANSFVAAHIINALIDAGHHVTGTVRKASTGDDIFALHPEWKDHLDIAVVADLTSQARWEELFQKNKFDHVGYLPTFLPTYLTPFHMSITTLEGYEY